MRLLQGGVALLNLSEHFVEAVNELAQLIGTVFGRADGIIFPHRNSPGCICEVEDRPGDNPLQQRRQKVGDR